MAEYHVGCGAFGIYAGTLNAQKTMWKNKSDVTDEAISAVVQYFKQELKCKDKTKFHNEYKFSDGTHLSFDIAITPESKEDK